MFFLEQTKLPGQGKRGKQFLVGYLPLFTHFTPSTNKKMMKDQMTFGNCVWGKGC